MHEVDFQSMAMHPHVAELLDDYRVDLPGTSDFLKSCCSFIDQERFLHLLHIRLVEERELLFSVAPEEWLPQHAA